jgi:hypothetical protein
MEHWFQSLGPEEEIRKRSEVLINEIKLNRFLKSYFSSSNYLLQQIQMEMES